MIRELAKPMRDERRRLATLRDARIDALVEQFEREKCVYLFDYRLSSLML